MKKIRPFPKELSIQRAAVLSQIYKEKNWNISTAFGNNEYDDFCSMLTYLNADQQDLIIDLTKDFLKVGFNEYIQHFLKSFDLFYHSSLSKGKNRVFIKPLLCKDDIGRTKSSSLLYYLINSHIVLLQNKYPNIKIICSDNFNSLNTAKFNKTDIICLVDDYVGTGETAIKAINFLQNSSTNICDLVAITLVAQEEGINNVKNCGYNIFAATVRSKGISDLSSNVESMLAIMESIESKMGVQTKYQLGYGRSESLVKMISTPNNTFPIYWYAKSKSIPIVPFPRR